MSNNAIVLHVGDFEVHAESKDAEPTVLDLMIGRRAGLARPRKVRDTIRRAIEDGTLREGEHFRREFRVRQIGAPENPAKYEGFSEIPSIFPEESPSPRIGAMEIPERIEEEFWLSEAGTFKVLARLRTSAAASIFDQMIRVYREALRQLREPQAPQPVPIISEVAHAPRVGDSEILRREVAFYCHAAKSACAVRIQTVHGFLRREFRVAGVYHLSVMLWPQAKAMLEALGMGRLALPARERRTLAPSNPNQRKLWS